MPHVSTELLAGLLAAAGQDDDLCAYGDELRPEPLCALYRTTVLPAVEQALASGKRKMISFWDGLRVDGTRLRARRVPRPTRPPAESAQRRFGNTYRNG